ncbi:hypothetical protein NEOLEDRAFT_435814 [Neolentinus lepideus HHB14362 ss-1]|uniref:Uncharacterized protein n=1 Tax=Neolentinus lepideus HHB14362 ss-1 TaxID=1314782 RepID=A0A165RW30_9AGAM|nr:hypothetical protein NEOLEDRAFT_435814 [Neolentinus lepideus HHB14362 ss-1]
MRGLTGSFLLVPRSVVLRNHSTKTDVEIRGQESSWPITVCLCMLQGEVWPYWRSPCVVYYAQPQESNCCCWSHTSGLFIPREEVTLVGCVLETPALLYSSRIGDSSVLEPLGIQTLLNLPTVGKNLREK